MARCDVLVSRAGPRDARPEDKLHETLISGLPEISSLDDASRVNPTCVDLGATRTDHRGEKARACRGALGARLAGARSSDAGR